MLFAFSKLQLDEVISFTAELNAPSIRVMEKLGMARYKSGDFEHPAVPEGHPVRPHVLYHIGSNDPILL